MTFFSGGKKITQKKYFFFLHISSSYAKILGEKLFRTWEIPRSGSKAKNGENTPGTVGGQGGRDRTLAVKSRKNAKKSSFFVKKIFCLHISSSYAKILGETNFHKFSPKWVKS